MRRIILWLLIAILTFVLGLASTAFLFLYDTTTVSTEIATAFLMKGMTDKSFEPSIETVTICELSKKPMAYLDKLIRVRATLVADASRLGMDLFEPDCYGANIWMDAWLDSSLGKSATPSNGVNDTEDLAVARFEEMLVPFLGSDKTHKPIVADVEIVSEVFPSESDPTQLGVFIINVSHAKIRKVIVPKRPHEKSGPC